jgi:Na+/proline symporter
MFICLFVNIRGRRCGAFVVTKAQIFKVISIIDFFKDRYESNLVRGHWIWPGKYPR